MIRTLGRLCDQSSVRQIQIDDLTLTYVVDGAMAMAPDRFLSSIPARYWQLHPSALNADGLIAMSAGSLLVERSGHRLLIDAGLGPVTFDDDVMRADSGDLLNNLAALDVTPADIDVVAFTHLHFDHTGWAFTHSASGWSPTFPRARYVLSHAELATRSDSLGHAYTSDLELLGESLRGLSNVSLIDDGDEVAAGVIAMVTPGHSPGHTSYVVISQSGQRVLVFGDVFHTPAQITNTAWTSDPDSDPSAVPHARERILAELMTPHTLGFAFHFGDQPFGRVVADAAGGLHWQAIASTALRPPPRRL